MAGLPSGKLWRRDGTLFLGQRTEVRALHVRKKAEPTHVGCYKPQTNMCLAIPGKVETITGDDAITRMGRINFGGVIKEASLAYVPEVQVGDYVIVHVGFALSKVDEDEAQKVFGYLKQIGELEELAAGQFIAPEASLPDGSRGRPPHKSSL